MRESGSWSRWSAPRRALTLAAVSALVLAGCSPLPSARTRRPELSPPVAGEVAPAVAPSAEVSDSAEPSRALHPLPLPAVRPRLVRSVPAAGRRVALTFDLCEARDETSGFDERIVEFLTVEKVPATFFMGGKWAESHPEEAGRLGAGALFEIGNHSWSHPDFERIGRSEMDRQIARSQTRIARLTGHTPMLFRFPFGTYSAESLSAVGRAGLIAVQWDVVTGDPDRNIDAEDMLRAVREGAGPGSIVIMHANGRGRHTAEALPAVVAWLRTHGYELVTVSELLAAERATGKRG